jgi:hypothetical protein
LQYGVATSFDQKPIRDWLCVSKALVRASVMIAQSLMIVA